MMSSTSKRMAAAALAAIGGSVLTHSSSLGTIGGGAVGGIIGHQVD
nr:hypothetical protein [Sodalis glossinidius]